MHFQTHDSSKEAKYFDTRRKVSSSKAAFFFCVLAGYVKRCHLACWCPRTQQHAPSDWSNPTSKLKVLKQRYQLTTCMYKP